MNKWHLRETFACNKLLYNWNLTVHLHHSLSNAANIEDSLRSKKDCEDASSKEQAQNQTIPL